MVIDRSRFLARFAAEAREHCATLTQGILSLETSPDDTGTLNALFRSAHTIKGSARMMKLTGIGELAHGMEDLLDAARAGRIRLNRSSFGLLLKSVDALVSMIAETETGEHASGLPVELCQALKREMASLSGENAQEKEKPAAVDSKAVLPVSSAGQPGFFFQAPVTGSLRVNTGKLDDLVRLMGEVVAEQGRLRLSTSFVQKRLRTLSGAVEGVSALYGKRTEETESARRVLQGLDVAMVEMRQAAQTLTDCLRMQTTLMGSLQEATLKLRMTPLSTVFEPLRRTFRDLAEDAGKDADFVVTGGETELDRKIGERIGDSLLHMIRNSLDHGLEDPEERRALGKAPKGLISLAAFYDKGGVTLVLRDDGRGLDTEKIRAKALTRRIFDEQTLASMSRAEIHNLIFLPGFSTSPIITDISGRGVGMDVVRQNIVHELRGSITLETQRGEGTSIFVHLPLNLAVFPLFIVEAGGLPFAIPATAIVEMHRVTKEDLIEIVGKKAMRLREQIVPVENLARLLRLDEKHSSPGGGALVVVRDGENQLGLLVDDVTDQEEMVVKPLPGFLSRVRIVTGGVIQGERVVSVLHIPEILRLAGEVSVESQTHAEMTSSLILVVDDSINTRELEKSILEAYGYRVETAEDGLEAFEKTRDTLYDLVITDIEMPRLDGFSLTEKLRSDPRYLAVPIIVVTSLEKESDRKRGIRAGADAYIVKQAFDQSNLLETIRSLIGG
ncbi:hybrid sensor histidine kinase/response regulator [Desulfobotulus sp.]|jgi:chemotaxis protein histidine kinase CheA/CheY-like chemotaxis protein|uniref:hybrid sensor histidine kinase/response regulator n=1 Tax=Desulfobotulus sp. TaxID=1940337 RepID=UPI002A367B8B|nr:hybrid sensor histidine kinase/response regulator [Desulfobotulus sp.]MDY0161615.1 hybrid sensor histidine kinase/response regulator [Desulfobotulus sp.]